jgi:hypothetical protein
MTRSLAVVSTASSTLAALSCAALVTAFGLTSRVASAQVDYPPAEFIATTEPVYYQGHAAYWYGGRWYYHDAHGGWGHYDREPQELANRRSHAPPATHFYGHAAASHPAGHGGRR